MATIKSVPAKGTSTKRTGTKGTAVKGSATKGTTARRTTTRKMPPRKTQGQPNATRYTARSTTPRTRRTTAPPRSTARATKIPESIAAHRRGRSVNRSVSVVAGIFFIFVFFYLIRSFVAFLATPNIPTETVKMGSIDIPEIVSGIIVRDETVYHATRAGTIKYSVSEYEKVKAGAMVCSIQNLEALADINQSLLSLEGQIMELQRLRSDISGVDPAVQRINGQIKNIVDSRLYQFATLNISEVYTLKESVLQNIDIRNNMILSENGRIREDLGTQQQQLQSRLNEYNAYIRAERGGIMSPVVDGLEAELTFENMTGLNKEQTQMQVDYDKIIPKRDVTADDPLFKIINSNDWYIAAYMPNELIEGDEEGDVRTLYIEYAHEYVPLSVTVAWMEAGYRETFVLYKVTKYLIDYLNMRSVNIKTTDSIRQGLKISSTAVVTREFIKVPNTCIYESDKSYVLKRTAEGDTVIPITFTERDDVYAYVLDDVPQLAIGDTLVAQVMETAQNPVVTQTPEDSIATAAGQLSETGTYILAEKLTVQGVYRVNNGIAEFKKVTLDEDCPQNYGYYILNPAKGQGIKVYDYIVTDAAGIQDGQIIF